MSVSFKIEIKICTTGRIPGCRGGSWWVIDEKNNLVGDPRQHYCDVVECSDAKLQSGADDGT